MTRQAYQNMINAPIDLSSQTTTDQNRGSSANLNRKLRPQRPITAQVKRQGNMLDQSSSTKLKPKKNNYLHEISEEQKNYNYVPDFETVSRNVTSTINVGLSSKYQFENESSLQIESASND